MIFLVAVLVAEKPIVPDIMSIHKYSGSSSRHMVKWHFYVPFEIRLGHKL